MPRFGEVSQDNKTLLEDSTYGLEALEALVDDLESRLTAARAGYLDNINNAKLLVLPIESIYFGTGTTTIAAGATEYIFCIPTAGENGSTASEHFVRTGWLCPRAGTLKNLICNAKGAPGDGESYIYTIRKNNADTELTVTISGASDVKGLDTTHTVTVAVGDRITLECVVSGGAAAQRHQASVEFEGV